MEVARVGPTHRTPAALTAWADLNATASSAPGEAMPSHAPSQALLPSPVIVRRTVAWHRSCTGRPAPPWFQDRQLNGASHFRNVDIGIALLADLADVTTLTADLNGARRASRAA